MDESSHSLLFVMAALYYVHFVFYCTHVRMSCVLNSYLLAYLDADILFYPCAILICYFFICLFFSFRVWFPRRASIAIRKFTTCLHLRRIFKCWRAHSHDNSTGWAKNRSFWALFRWDGATCATPYLLIASIYLHDGCNLFIYLFII